MGGEVVKLDASSFQIQSLAWSTSSSTLFVGAEVNVFLEPVAKLGGGGEPSIVPPPSIFRPAHLVPAKPFFIKFWQLRKKYQNFSLALLASF